MWDMLTRTILKAGAAPAFCRDEASTALTPECSVTRATAESHVVVTQQVDVGHFAIFAAAHRQVFQYEFVADRLFSRAMRQVGPP